MSSCNTTKMPDQPRELKPRTRQRSGGRFVPISWPLSVCSSRLAGSRITPGATKEPTRIAAFEVLKTLGELQLVVDYAYYRKERARGDATIGWTRVQCIKDLATILPSPGPEDAERLLQTWRTSVETLETDPQGAAKISDDIYATRQDLVAIIQHLR